MSMKSYIVFHITLLYLKIFVLILRRDWLCWRRFESNFDFVLYWCCAHSALREADGTGCFVSRWFVGAIAYADDSVLLAPTAMDVRRMLSICNFFCHQVSYHSMLVKLCVWYFAQDTTLLEVCISVLFASFTIFTIVPFLHGIEIANQWTHLGHVNSSKSDDVYDILRCRNILIGWWVDK